MIGAQANVWTEYIKTTEKCEYMVFPRASALAEVVWSKKETKNFQSFVERLGPHLKKLQALGAKPANRLYDLAVDYKAKNNQVEVALNCLMPNQAIHYALDGEVCLLYTSPSPRDLSTSRMPSSA